MSTSPPSRPSSTISALRSAFSRKSVERLSDRSSTPPAPSSPSFSDDVFVACEVTVAVERVSGVPPSGEDLPPWRGDCLAEGDVHVAMRMAEGRGGYNSQKIPHGEAEVGDRVAFVMDDIGKAVAVEIVAKSKWRKDVVLEKATLELSQYRLFSWQEVSIPLGQSILSCSVQILPVTSSQRDEFVRRSNGPIKVEYGRNGRGGSSSDFSIINLVLIRGFSIGDSIDPPDAICKFKLGNEKYKSRVILKSTDPEWGENFEMKLPKGIDTLEIQVYCRREKKVLSEGQMNLSGLPRDMAIRQEVSLGPSSSLSLIVSVPRREAEGGVLPNVAPPLRTTLKAGEVGELVIKVIRAENVEAMDIGGKSDPFAIVRVGNQRVRTHTHYATLNPEWNRLFVLPLEDIHAVVDVSFFDEDSTGKADFLGRVAVPLLAIFGWERRWFALKDRKLLKATRGRVLLELRVQYDLIRSVVRTFNPREKEYQVVAPKFKPSVLKSSIAEIRRFGAAFAPVATSIDNICTWKRPSATLFAILFYITFMLYVEIFHLPLLLILLILFISYRHKYCPDAIAPPPPSPKENESNVSILSITDTLVEVQQTVASITLVLQRIRNASDGTWPWLTCLLLFVLSAASAILYLVPVRYLLLAWGVNKMTKKLRKPPNYIDNNEVADFLSRVPSDRQLREWSEPEESSSLSPS